MGTAKSNEGDQYTFSRCEGVTHTNDMVHETLHCAGRRWSANFENKTVWNRALFIVKEEHVRINEQNCMKYLQALQGRVNFMRGDYKTSPFTEKFRGHCTTSIWAALILTAKDDI